MLAGTFVDECIGNDVIRKEVGTHNGRECTDFIRIGEWKQKRKL